MQLQPSAQEKKRSKGKKALSMSQDTGMSLDYELELDESLFEKDNFTRPRSKSEDRVIDRRRHSSEEPIISLNGDLRKSTITENEEEEQEEELENENSSELEPNEAIASLLMSVAVDPVPPDTVTSLDLGQDENTTGTSPKEEVSVHPLFDHTAENEFESSEQSTPNVSQTVANSNHTLAEDGTHSHTSVSSDKNVVENGEIEHTLIDTNDEQTNSAVALSDNDSMTKMEQDSMQELENQETSSEANDQNSTSAINDQDCALEVKGEDSLSEMKSQESSSEMKGHDSTSEISDKESTIETRDQDLTSEMQAPNFTPEMNGQDSTPEIKGQKDSTIVMKGREIFSSSGQVSSHRTQDTRTTADTGSRVAELREMFLGFSGTQKQNDLKQPPPQRYSRQRHALHNGTNRHGVETAGDSQLKMGNQNHTAEIERIEVDSEQENSDKDMEDNEEEVDNEDGEMLSASRPNLDLTGSEVLLRVPKLTNSSAGNRLSPLALYSRSMSDTETSSHTNSNQDEQDDDNSNSSVGHTADGDDFISTPTVRIITRPKWLASQEAEDELSSGESETDLIQPLTPFSSQHNTSNQGQSNGHTQNSPNNLYHLAAKKKAQQRVSEALVANTLSTAGRAQVTALTSIPEEY